MQNFLKLRSNILKVVLVAAMTVISIRLFSIQILKHDEYVAMAETQHTMQNTIVAKRGEIYVMDGEDPVPIVMNAKVWSIILDPQVSKWSREEVEKTLKAEVGEYITADFNDIFSDNFLRYYIVARNVPYTEAQRVKEKNLPGVWMQGTTKRVYPEGTMASGLLGFVNNDGVGQYGVEGALNEELSGVNGVLKTVKDVNNIPLTIGDDNVKIPAVDGKNIVLSIDRNVQNKAEQVLAAKTKEFGVSHGTVIVMDPKNGEIWAIASTPNYDAANFGKVENAEVYQTNATMDAYEPASVCKTFAMAAAIDMGKMTPDTTYNNTDQTIVDGWPINNLTKGHTGKITMQTALNYSLNTGSTQALRLLGDSETDITQVGKDRLFDYYYNKFWLGKYTGIEIAESSGIIIGSDDVNGTDARYANMTFGQGMNITALQLAAAYSAIVNGGDYFKPTVVRGEMVNGDFRANEYAAADHNVISSETSKTMRKMLVGARNLFRNSKNYDSGLYIGGKTGTAQVIRNGAYVMNETVATYAGFGAESENDPAEYVIVTKIWEDGKGMDGGSHAKPVFDEISQFMINYLRMSKRE
ncbi:penicillin-binding protein 2 [Candidatus Saccharibacteria bacterium]|nr:penicillin-binding protein 2 [Candidatus Saccharibacteria bacterium]